MKPLVAAVAVLTALVLCVPVQAQTPEIDALRVRAEAGDAVAQYDLGVMYANGLGVPEDDAEAVRWYRLAADQGHADAQLSLGFKYEDGQGVPQDLVQAHMWVKLVQSGVRRDHTASLRTKLCRRDQERSPGTEIFAQIRTRLRSAVPPSTSARSTAVDRRRQSAPHPRIAPPASQR